MTSTTAIIATGGKQYRVAPGDVIDVELLGDVSENGDAITFDQLLFVSGEDGAKMGDDLSGAKVTGVLLDQVKGPKIRVFKMKRRKGYRRTNGHRQKYHRVRIDAIDV
jgi:large subunit ribosomal protein L21